MKKTLISIGSFITLSLPMLVLAADPELGTGYFSKLIRGATTLLKDVLIFLISLAVVWFIWNVVKYAMSSEEDGKEKAKSQMINGIIAIAVIVSVWGLVAILQSIFGVNTSGAGNVTNLLPKN